MRVRLKYVKWVKAKGRIYYYHSRTGERLPDDAGQRAARVLAVNGTLEGTTAEHPEGSLGALIARYKAAPEFTTLRERTKKDYLRYLDFLGTFDDVPVTDIDRPFVLELRDTLSDRPRTANYAMAVLRRVLAIGVDLGWADSNPATRPKLLKTGPGHKSWPMVAIERFREGAPSELVWAMEVGLYTGQREGDCLTIGWRHYDSGVIAVAQAKTGARLDIPVHPHLAEVLATIPRRGTMMLTTSTGRPWKPDHFCHQWRKAILVCGLDGLTFHGLRHTAGNMLAEAGCTDREIMAILGHKTAAMVTRYTAQADQKDRVP